MLKKTGIKIQSRQDIVDNIENIRIYVRGHNLYDIFYGRYKKQENEILTKYIEAAPRGILADILERDQMRLSTLIRVKKKNNTTGLKGRTSKMPALYKLLRIW